MQAVEICVAQAHQEMGTDNNPFNTSANSRAGVGHLLRVHAKPWLQSLKPRGGSGSVLGLPLNKSADGSARTVLQQSVARSEIDLVRRASLRRTLSPRTTIGRIRGRKHSTLRHPPPRSDLDTGLAPGPVRLARVHLRVGADCSCKRCAAFVERRTRKTGDPRFRARHHRPSKSLRVCFEICGLLKIAWEWSRSKVLSNRGNSKAPNARPREDHSRHAHRHDK